MTSADPCGRKPVFISEMVLLAGALIAAVVLGSNPVLSTWRIFYLIPEVLAALTAFLCPTLLAQWGTEGLLPLLTITSLVGEVITWIYRIETTGIDMDSI